MPIHSDLNFYAYNYKIHVSEAHNVNTSKYEKLIFGGFRSVLYCTSMGAVPNVFGSIMLATMTLDILPKIFVCNGVLKKLTPL